MNLGNFPKVSVHFEIKEDAILSSRLALSDCFSCTGANELLLQWLISYARGISSPLPLLLTGTPFQQKALLTLQQIPFGQLISYGKLAELCGYPRGARAIGNACNRNPFPLLIPCHRVIYTSGKIGGFAVDLEIKRRLLEFEKRLS